MRRRAALPLLLLAAAALAAAEVSPDQLNAYLGTVPVQNADEAAVASQLIRGFESVADEILTGRENPIVFSAAAPIDNTSAVNVSDVQAKVRPSAEGWMVCPAEIASMAVIRQVVAGRCGIPARASP